MSKSNLYSYGITFNGQHSTEFGLDVLNDKKIGLPDKVKSTVSITNSNVIYDFGGLYGVQAMTEREVKLTFKLIDRNNISKDSLYMLFTRVCNWLYSPLGKVKLFDDIMPNYYFMAEAQKGANFDELRYHGKLTVTFTCDPYRVDTSPEGNDLWDPFCFELDVAQNTAYEVLGEQDVTLINPGMANVDVFITCNGEFEVIHKGVKYLLQAGTEQDVGLSLLSGLNSLKIIGDGAIGFIFHKGLI